MTKENHRKLPAFLDRIERDPAYREHLRTGPWTATEEALLWEAAPRDDPELRQFAQNAAHLVLCRDAYRLRNVILMRLAGDETLTAMQRHKLDNILRALDDAFAGEVVGFEPERK